MMNELKKSWKQIKIEFYSSGAWKSLREQIRKRDKEICQYCGKMIKNKGIVHHIKEITPDNINDPNITLNPDNLILVHDECHKKIHKKGFAKKDKKESIVDDELNIDYSKR